MKLPNQFQPERLNKFADRLITIDVKPRVKIIDEDTGLYYVDDQVCGSIPFFYGPISQLPKIFKNEWSFADGEYYWKEDPNRRTLSSLRDFFGIGLSMIGHIFIPGAQMLRLFGGRMLTSNAKSADIAFNIHHLILSQNIGLELIKEINVFISKN